MFCGSHSHGPLVVTGRPPVARQTVTSMELMAGQLYCVCVHAGLGGGVRSVYVYFCAFLCSLVLFQNMLHV